MELPVGGISMSLGSDAGLGHQLVRGPGGGGVGALGRGAEGGGSLRQTLGVAKVV